MRLRRTATASSYAEAHGTGQCQTCPSMRSNSTLVRVASGYDRTANRDGQAIEQSDPKPTHNNQGC